jgi:hypothetical protein
VSAPLVIDADGPTGNEIIRMVGWRREVKGVTKRVYDAAGCDLGNMTASQVTAELLARGLVTFVADGEPWSPAPCHRSLRAMACPCVVGTEEQT